MFEKFTAIGIICNGGKGTKGCVELRGCWIEGVLNWGGVELRRCWTKGFLVFDWGIFGAEKSGLFVLNWCVELRCLCGTEGYLYLKVNINLVVPLLLLEAVWSYLYPENEASSIFKVKIFDKCYCNIKGF